MNPKKFFNLLLLCVFTLPNILSAAEIAAEGTAARKAQRGFLNVALSPMEVTRELADAKKAGEKCDIEPSWLVGLSKGSFKMVGRAIVGVYDMITFPISYPRDKSAIVSPEFPWQLLGDSKNPS